MSKILPYFRVNYQFTSKDSPILRSGSQVISAPTDVDARHSVIKTLGPKHPFYKITKVELVENEQTQKTL